MTVREQKTTTGLYDADGRVEDRENFMKSMSVTMYNGLKTGESETSSGTATGPAKLMARSYRPEKPAGSTSSMSFANEAREGIR